MNRTLAGVFALALCFAVGHALQCYKCDIGLGSLCATSKVTCNTGDLCFSGKGAAATVISITQKGCLTSSLCNQTSNVNIPGTNNATIYKMTKTCCSTDFCNSAAPLTNTLILTLSSLLLAKLLI